MVTGSTMIDAGPAGENVADPVRRRDGRAARGELTGPPQPWNELAAIADHLSAPQVIFTQPEVAVVGLTEAAAVISPMGEIVTEAHLRPGSRATFSAHRFPGRPNGRPSGEATGRWDVHRYG
jgi:pyruvate/2-oxoglutarate dehydrogenase complex dihydrolipoamide dehydrogenase (E3) component